MCNTILNDVIRGQKQCFRGSKRDHKSFNPFTGPMSLPLSSQQCGTSLGRQPRKHVLLLGTIILMFLALHSTLGTFTSSEQLSPGAVIDSFITEARQGRRRCVEDSVISTFNEKVHWRLKNDRRAIWGVVVGKNLAPVSQSVS